MVIKGCNINLFDSKSSHAVRNDLQLTVIECLDCLLGGSTDYWVDRHTEIQSDQHHVIQSEITKTRDTSVVLQSNGSQNSIFSKL